MWMHIQPFLFGGKMPVRKAEEKDIDAVAAIYEKILTEEENGMCSIPSSVVVLGKFRRFLFLPSLILSPDF